MKKENSSHSSIPMRKPVELPIPFRSPWHIVLPSVYRYEDEKWIDKFFETGQLRLSTFEKFSQYEDENRGDENEGSGIAMFTNGKQDVWSVLRQGMNCFVLSCSLTYKQDLQEKFERNSAFIIENIPAFAQEVARQIPGYINGIQGHCIYRKDTSIIRESDFDLEELKLPEGGDDMNRMADWLRSNHGGVERVLLKSKKYEHQQEYRLMWEIDGEIEEKHIDIICPRAVQFCRRLSSKD